MNHRDLQKVVESSTKVIFCVIYKKKRRRKGKENPLKKNRTNLYSQFEWWGHRQEGGNTKEGKVEEKEEEIN